MTAPVPVVDQLFVPLMAALRDCLAAQLPPTPAGRACRAYLYWGQNPPVMDGCHCDCTTGDGPGNGDCWVRLARVDPDTGVGLYAAGAGAVLASAECPLGWIVTLGLGTYRCVPVPDAGGPLPEATVSATTAMLASDLTAVRQVLGCCPTLDDLTWVPVTYLPMRAADCGGGEFQIRVALPATQVCGGP